MIAHDKVLAAMGTRFDYYSARAVLGDALRKAGIATGKDAYSADDVRALSSAVAALHPRTEGVVAALKGLADSEPAGKTKAAHAPAPEPAPEPDHAAEAAAEAPAEAPVEGGDEGAADKPKKKKK
jgi:hypothetical protein